MAWAVAEAKAKFSELIEIAREKGAQQITRNGKLVGLMVSPEEWDSKTRPHVQNQRSMSQFFKNSPLAGSGLELARSRSKVRKVEL